MFVRKKILRVTIFVGATSIYILLLAWMRWCPPVSGDVIDSETSLPISGAEIVRVGEGPYLVSYESQSHYESKSAQGKTNQVGEFGIPPTVLGNLGILSVFPFGWVNRVGLTVYAEGYVPIGLHEDVWNDVGTPGQETTVNDGWEVIHLEHGVIKRRHKSLFGYEYRIEIRRAITEQDWIEKCDQTIFLTHLYLSPDFRERWLLADLAGYLTMWPQGEKRCAYLEVLSDLGMEIYPRHCDRQNLRRHNLSELQAALRTAKRIAGTIDEHYPVGNTIDKSCGQLILRKREVIGDSIAILEKEIADRTRGPNEK